MTRQRIVLLIQVLVLTMGPGALWVRGNEGDGEVSCAQAEKELREGRVERVLQLLQQAQQNPPKPSGCLERIKDRFSKETPSKRHVRNIASLTNSDGTTWLMLAAEKGNLEVMEETLRHQPTLLNQKDKKGNTALMRAVSAGQPEAVKLLLEKYADPNILNREKKSPVQISLDLILADRSSEKAREVAEVLVSEIISRTKGEKDHFFLDGQAWIVDKFYKGRRRGEGYHVDYNLETNSAVFLHALLDAYNKRSPAGINQVKVGSNKIEYTRQQDELYQQGFLGNTHYKVLGISIGEMSNPREAFDDLRGKVSREPSSASSSSSKGEVEVKVIKSE